MFVIHANMVVKPEQKENFLEQMKLLMQGSQAEEGNIRYTLMQDINDPNAFTMVEEWKDEEAMKFHNATEHFQNFVASAPEFLAAPMQAKVFSADQINK
ncbi:putative quinol monooxygenase [Paenibacillus sp. JX-17]|uniref:Quinol monooxygenase n=1 Tax=Paenibacillus lacisoli TaxID=3064525 RepID=A0ABT9CHY7_9BACL|nr:putative quinol monooxygenase [Paenibacillus sp. JX-17]MDO7907542.1 putative quinol monooxygenase [Paenibacillus sp. JX-17]